MKKLAILSIVLVPVFFICWTIAYIICTGFDFSYYWKYLRLTFSNRGGEIVGFIRVYAILLLCVSIGIIFFVMHKK